MEKYRIVERKGDALMGPCFHLAKQSGIAYCCYGKECLDYIPRYVVQTLGKGCCNGIYDYVFYEDLHAFDDLMAAKQYKRSLQLIDGRVVG